MVTELTGFLEKKSFDSAICSTIYHYSEVGSTNTIAREKIDEEQSFGFVVVSERQTGGYGQRGNKWESPIGGLWCSIVLKPTFHISKIGLMPILAALSVAKTLDSLSIKTRLKWPNDILHYPDNKKIAGILVEGKVSQDSLEYIIIGIGMNVNNTSDQFSRSLRRKTTSIFEILDEKIPIMDIMASLLEQLEDQLLKLQNNNETKILSEWKKWDNVLGLNVRILSNDIEYIGIARDISTNGQLLLELKDGRTMKFSTGDLIL